MRSARRGGDVGRLVIGQGVRLALVGLAIGGAISLAASRWIQPLLFQQSARDPAVFAVVAVMLMLVALIASAVPAVRAMQAPIPNAVSAERASSPSLALARHRPTSSS